MLVLALCLVITRHRASTSMYSLTFCVRFLLPERHQWKARIPECRSNVENAPRRRPVAGGPAAPACRMRRAVLGAPPVARRRPATSVASRRRADPAHPAVRTMSSYRGMDASLELGFALCSHSNATRAPIANLRNSAQLGAASTMPPSYIRVRAVVWAYGRGQTNTQTDTDNLKDIFNHSPTKNILNFIKNTNLHDKL